METDGICTEKQKVHIFCSRSCMCIGTSVTDLFFLMEKMMDSLLALTPGFSLAFDEETVILTLPTTTASSLQELSSNSQGVLDWPM